MTTMDLSAGAPVVVGIDGSPSSLAAVRLAAREAALHTRPLRIVHAFNWVADSAAPSDGRSREQAEQLAGLAAAAAAGAEPSVEISTALIEGPADITLLRESGSAALVVLGDGDLATRGYGLDDPISVRVAARAGCSVLVAREVPPPTGTILVGVDRSPSSPVVLDFAFDSAARRAAELLAVRVGEPGGTETGAAEQLAEAVAPWQRKYPSVPVRQRLRTGDPAAVLLDESRSAEIAVVSARGEQRWRGMLGEVSQVLLYHSPAPVVIVRSPHELYIQA
jgi:nucleotide-binding universal stress UspA family protein